MSLTRGQDGDRAGAEKRTFQSLGPGPVFVCCALFVIDPVSNFTAVSDPVTPTGPLLPFSPHLSFPAHLFICIPFPYLSICVYILHQLHSRSAKLSSFVCLAFSSCICACLFPSLTPYPICLSFGRITRLDPLPVFFVWAISKIHVTLTLIVFVFKVCEFNSVSRHYKYDWTSWSGGDGRQRWREHDENPLGVDEYNRQLWVRERKRACVCGRKLKQGEMDGGSRGRASPARRPGPAQTDGDTEWPECVTRWQ